MAGRGARVTGVNDLSDSLRVAVSPEGAIIVGDIRFPREKLVRFHDGSGQLVNAEPLAALWHLFCSPNGAIYVLRQAGAVTVCKLVGTKLEPVIAWDVVDSPEHFRFGTDCLFVTREEVVYVADFHRILRIKPGETTPVIVGEVGTEATVTDPWFCGVFVTERDQIYVADRGRRKVWVFNPGDTCGIEVLEAPENLQPVAVMVQDQSLYVCMHCCDAGGGNLDVLRASESRGTGVYQYALPPEITLA